MRIHFTERFGLKCKQSVMEILIMIILKSIHLVVNAYTEVFIKQQVANISTLMEQPKDYL